MTSQQIFPIPTYRKLQAFLNDTVGLKAIWSYTTVLSSYNDKSPTASALQALIFTQQQSRINFQRIPKILRYSFKAGTQLLM